MKLAIMQPYFCPYIGYFQLINSVDLFIIYDNIKYTKKGWINRNRILQNGKDMLISLPLKNESDFLDIKDRYLAYNFNKVKFLNKIKGAYNKAPFFLNTFSLLNKIIWYNDNNLFNFNQNSIKLICNYIGLNTLIEKSSDVESDSSLKGQDRVISLCKNVGANIYINAIGGINLYSKEKFINENIELYFIKSKEIKYNQFDKDFCSNLSIIDIMMFNSKENINKYLCSYNLVTNE